MRYVSLYSTLRLRSACGADTAKRVRVFLCFHIYGIQSDAKVFSLSVEILVGDVLQLQQPVMMHEEHQDCYLQFDTGEIDLKKTLLVGS